MHHDLLIEARALLEHLGDTLTDSRFNELALRLFALQQSLVPVYQSFCNIALRQNRFPANWRELPCLPIAAFKEFDCTSLPPQDRVRVFHSSGTTLRHPARHYHDPDSLALYEASVTHGFEYAVLAGRPAEFTLVSLTPDPADALHSSLAHMLGTLGRRFSREPAQFLGARDPQGNWTLNVRESITRIADQARQQRPLFLAGTAFGFMQLLDAADWPTPQHLPLPPGSLVLETGGYKGRSRTLPKEQLHALLSRVFSVPQPRILGEYGMCELGSQAYDCLPASSQSSSPRAFQFPPWARARVLDPETGREVAEGQTGVIAVVDLANVASVLALQTEDLGIRRGSAFELVGRVPAAEPRGCSLLHA